MQNNIENDDKRFLVMAKEAYITLPKRYTLEEARKIAKEEAARWRIVMMIFEAKEEIGFSEDTEQRRLDANL